MTGFKMDLNIEKSLLTASILLALSLQPVMAMQALSDDELKATEGQALVNLSYLAPTDSGSNAATNGNVGFYKLGLEAELEINANIKKLQLGCGGINGAGACDIDMDNVSLSGIKLDSSGNPLPMTREERASSSAKLTNPSIEFAIKNPDSASTREVIGIKLGSELAQGLLTVGSNDGTKNGINSLSGYMNIASTNGTTKTAQGSLTQTITGRVNIGGCIAGCPANFTTDNKPLTVNGIGTVPFTTLSSDVVGNRLTSAIVQAIAKVPDIALTPASGTRSADIAGTIGGCFVVAIVPLCNYSIDDLRINGTISNLYTKINLNQSLGLIHSIPIKSPLSLSLQNQAIVWPGAPVSPITGDAIAAQRGWWLAANDPINLGTLSTASGFAADISSAYPEVASVISTYLYNHPLYVPFGDAVGSVFTSTLTAQVGVVNLNAATNPAIGGNPVTVNLADLPLGSAQNVTPNCYGGLTFC